MDSDDVLVSFADMTVCDLRPIIGVAGLDEAICAMPNGYNTSIGEGGRTLSRGERQLLAIARATVCQ